MSEKQYAALQRTLRKLEANVPKDAVQKRTVHPSQSVPKHTPPERPARTHRSIKDRSPIRQSKLAVILFLGAVGLLFSLPGDDTGSSGRPGVGGNEVASMPLKKVSGTDELAVSVSLQPRPMPSRTQKKRKTETKSPHSVPPGSIGVVDGDTIRLGSNERRIRLVGYNTPETWKPRCARGEALGKRATARLNQLVRAAKTAEVEFVACACKQGTQGTKNCSFGRACAYLRVDGQDVGKTLIAEGLAASFICGRTSCPPLPRPWCR
ncbi:thermonuclease family protein [Aliiruegeria sabulilitoris]|uniref:thermonuclease family protein n=1 Tax=Aliiruegeria sabulilitoris TaxID=1510458 RepID=UPI0012E331BD|nr:thermonuclease family protein [Pseudoruegeria sp. M32A2M]